MQVVSVKHDSTTLKDRVKKLRKQNHYSQVELAKELNVSQSVISLIESGNASISIDILKKLSKLFNKSCDWLIYGKDTYVKITLDNEFIPLIRMDARAGYIQNHHKADYLEALDLYKIPGFTKGDFRIFEVDGDSMTPLLLPSDQVVCERISNLDRVMEGTINVVILNRDILVKRVYFSHGADGKVLLQSDNSAYKDISISRDEIKEVWQVKSKITDSFLGHFDNHSRVEEMEKEMREIKSQLAVIISKLEEVST